ncbi:MAG: Hsp20/alpha crystallin family protein [Erysipelotrichaceae bacterium]|nr:Hsp20/alpha crystallin family protein [Erysipelotrichaceae bacterium]MBO4537806.1 Hsp20/alpha crystallin family protein [Erysipelotrichaceae bacterium]MBR5048349.1 Hsp20/alpha crystallin family protein [Erysipelotrichaceae bacterium]
MLNYYLNPRKSADRSFFDDFFAPTFYRGNFSGMHTDITEKEDEYLLEVELPGYKKEDVKISLEDGYLKIEASKNTENKEETRKYISREIYRGSMSRSFYVGNIDQNKVKANFNDGILEISVPKDELPEEDKTKYIDIK